VVGGRGGDCEVLLLSVQELEIGGWVLGLELYQSFISIPTFNLKIHEVKKKRT
jgi:hypothetical protein